MKWFATVCSGLWSGVSMALMIAFNSIIISSLQEEQDPRLRITFEQASWIRKILIKCCHLWSAV